MFQKGNYSVSYCIPCISSPTIQRQVENPQRREFMALLRRTAVGLAVLITVGLLGSMCAQTEKAPAGNKSASKSQVVNEQAKTRGAGEQDPNTKNNSEKNSPTATAAPPASKSGKRGAGPYECGIHVDNRTAWFARIYVDGNYV